MTPGMLIFAASLVVALFSRTSSAVTHKLTTSDTRVPTASHTRAPSSLSSDDHKYNIDDLISDDYEELLKYCYGDRYDEQDDNKVVLQGLLLGRVPRKKIIEAQFMRAPSHFLPPASSTRSGCLWASSATTTPTKRKSARGCTSGTRITRASMATRIKPTAALITNPSAASPKRGPYVPSLSLPFWPRWPPYGSWSGS